MGPALDLTGIRVVDNHCHALEEDQRPASVGAWRSHFTESPHQSMHTRDAADTAFYRRLLHAMTEFYGVADDEQSEQATLAARGRSTTGEIAAALFADAGVAGLVVDTGFPSADTTFAKAALTEATGVQQVDAASNSASAAKQCACFNFNRGKSSTSSVGSGDCLAIGVATILTAL